MIRSSKQRGSLESRRPVQGDGLDCRNSPWSCPGKRSTPGRWYRYHYKRVKMGLWRSGSALPWHGRGRGFNPRQLHHNYFAKKGGTAVKPLVPIQGDAGVFCMFWINSG